MSLPAKTRTIQVRASNMPRFLQCPASAQGTKYPIEEPPSGPRQVGNAVHRILAHFLRGEGLPVSEVVSELGLTGQEAKQVRIFSYMGRNLWHEVAPYLEILEVENYLTHEIETDKGTIQLSGHADSINVSPDEELVVWDWKTGRWRDQRDQLLTYALLSLDQWQEYGPPVWIATCWIRSREISYEKVTERKLAPFLHRLRWATEHLDTYNPGPHCRYCEKKWKCEPRHDALRDAVATLDNKEPEQFDPERMAALWPKVKMVKKAARNFRDKLEEILEDHGQAIPLDDNREVYLKEYPRKPVDLEKALPVLRDEFDEWCDANMLVELLPALRLSKSKLKDMIADRAEHGQKGKRKKELMNKLEEAGAITESWCSKPDIRERSDK